MEQLEHLLRLKLRLAKGRVQDPIQLQNKGHDQQHLVVLEWLDAVRLQRILRILEQLERQRNKSQTSSNEVETRRVQATPAQTKYRYGRYTNGSKAHFNDKKGKELYGGTWRLQYSGWYTSRQAPTATNWGYTSTNNTIGTGRWNSSKKMYYWDRYVVDGKAYYWEESQTTAATYKTQYRYRTKTTTYYYYKWSDWSSYSDSYQLSSSAKEVRTRTLYRYCDRSKIPTYHYERWSDWSNWTTTPISSSSTKKVESHVFYRHKDKASKKTYIYSRWGSWSDWSETPAYKTDTTQVETQTMYRYKSR